MAISSLKDDEPDVLGPSQEGKPFFISHSKDPPFPLAEASELRDEGNPVRKRRKHKCIRVKPDKVKLVLGLDVGLEKVEGLMKLALVGRFMGKEVKGDSLKQWMDANWRLTLGYIPIFHLLVRGGICFEMRKK